MKNQNLYAVLLGGKISKNHLMEDHHLVFVVAENEDKARELSKKKGNADDIHIDGYQINLVKTNKQDDDFNVNPEYSA